MTDKRGTVKSALKKSPGTDQRMPWSDFFSLLDCTSCDTSSNLDENNQKENEFMSKGISKKKHRAITLKVGHHTRYIGEVQDHEGRMANESKNATCHAEGTEQKMLRQAQMQKRLDEEEHDPLLRLGRFIGVVDPVGGKKSLDSQHHDHDLAGRDPQSRVGFSVESGPDAKEAEGSAVDHYRYEQPPAVHMGNKYNGKDRRISHDLHMHGKGKDERSHNRHHHGHHHGPNVGVSPRNAEGHKSWPSPRNPHSHHTHGHAGSFDGDVHHRHRRSSVEGHGTHGDGGHHHVDSPKTGNTSNGDHHHPHPHHHHHQGHSHGHDRRHSLENIHVQGEGGGWTLAGGRADNVPVSDKQKQADLDRAALGPDPFDVAGFGR